MSGLKEIDSQWVPLQNKVFTRWVNGQLKGTCDHEIESVTKDLTSGVELVQLAEKLTGKQPPRAWAKEPKRNVEMVQNLDLAIDMFSKDGVNLIGTSGKDIHDRNEKLTLGLIWSLILHYQVSKSVRTGTTGKANDKSGVSTKSDKDALMSWANERVSSYHNLNSFDKYDLSMCALLDSYVPEKVNYYSLDPNDTEHNSQVATNVMNDLGIPVYVYPEDVVNNNDKVDEKY